MTAFASRNAKEMLRDPLTLVFGVGLPVILILFISMLQSRIGDANPAFLISSFAPGMAVFSFSFISLFSGMLVSGDRTSSFLMRVFASPLRAHDYIIGYTLPLIPIALAQSAVCFLVSACFGLTLNAYTLLALLVIIPSAALFAAFGLLFGTLFSDKQLGGIFTIFVNIGTWLSGTWFDLELIGGAFKTIGYLLPFAHAVDMTRAAISGDLSGILPHLWWVLGYAIAAFVLASVLFKRKMEGK